MFTKITVDIISLREQTDHCWHPLSFLRNNLYEAWMVEIKYNNLVLSGGYFLSCFLSIIVMVHTLNELITLGFKNVLNWTCEKTQWVKLLLQSVIKWFGELEAIFKMKAGSTHWTGDLTHSQFPGLQFTFHYSSLCAVVCLLVGFSVYWIAIKLDLFHLSTIS